MTWQSIKPVVAWVRPIRFSGLSVLPIHSASFLLLISSSLTLLFTFVSFFFREHKLQSHIRRFTLVASSAEANWMLLCGDCTSLCNMAASKWQLWELLTWGESNGQTFLEILLLVLLVLSAFPVLTNKRVLYTVYIVYEKWKQSKKFQKWNWTRAVRRGQDGRVVQNGSNISQSVKRFFFFKSTLCSCCWLQLQRISDWMAI